MAACGSGFARRSNEVTPSNPDAAEFALSGVWFMIIKLFEWVDGLHLRAGGQGFADVAVTCLFSQGAENTESVAAPSEGKRKSRGTFAKRVLKSTVGAAAVAARGKVAAQRKCARLPDASDHEGALTCQRRCIMRVPSHVSGIVSTGPTAFGIGNSIHPFDTGRRAWFVDVWGSVS